MSTDDIFKFPIFMYVNNVAGVLDNCNNDGVGNFTTILSNWSGAQGHCMYAHCSIVVNSQII